MEEQRGKKMLITILIGFLILALLFAWSVVRMRVAAGLPAWGYREGGPTSTPTLTPTSTPGPTPTAHPGGSEAQPGNIQSPATPEPLPEFAVEKIAFTSDRTGQPQVYVINSDGSYLLELTDEINGANLLGWMRGERLAYVAWPAGQPVIYGINAGGQERAPLAGLPTDGSSYAWSADGNSIAVSRAESGNLDIYVMRYDGTQEMTVASSPAREDQPAWSPDGEKLVFVSDRDRRESDLYTINRDDTGLTRLTDDELYESNPAWSPDGEQIAFIASPTLHGYIGNIVTVGADGSDRQQLTDDATAKRALSWSRDGRRLFFQAETERGWGLYLLNVADGMTALLADDYNPEAMTLYAPPAEIEPEEEEEEEEPEEELPPLTAAERAYLETVLDIAASYDQAMGDLTWLMEVADENIGTVVEGWWRDDFHAVVVIIKEENSQRVRELVPPARFLGLHNDLVLAAINYNTVADLIIEARDTVDGYPIYRAREEFMPVGDAALNRAVEEAYKPLD